MQQAGLDCVVLGGSFPTPEKAQRFAVEALSRVPRPTAFFAANTLVMHAIMQAAQQLELRVPEDVALAGFEDFRWAGFVKPGLTVIRQPAEDMGRQAARMLFERLAGKTGPPQTVVLDTEFIIRESCGCGALESDSFSHARYCGGSWLNVTRTPDEITRSLVFRPGAGFVRYRSLGGHLPGQPLRQSSSLCRCRNLRG